MTNWNSREAYNEFSRIVYASPMLRNRAITPPLKIETSAILNIYQPRCSDRGPESCSNNPVINGATWDNGHPVN